MTIRAGFFNSINQDRLYNAADMNMPYKKLISNGVIPDTADALQVMAGSGLTVTVQPGSGLFGDGWAYNDAPVALAIETAHSTLDRIDLIVIRRDDNENVRATGLFVKKGTPATSPVAPQIERSAYVKEYALAEIHVKKQAAGVTQANIVDTRADTTRCGWCTGIITQVDTSTLFLQWKTAYEEQFAENWEAFNAWWNSAKTILASDTSAAAKILDLERNKSDRVEILANLTTTGWVRNNDGYYYQTFTDERIGESDVIIISAAPASIDNWSKWGVVCTGQAAGALTFRATAATGVTVNILNLGGAN